MTDSAVYKNITIDGDNDEELNAGDVGGMIDDEEDEKVEVRNFKCRSFSRLIFCDMLNYSLKKQGTLEMILKIFLLIP